MNKNNSEMTKTDYVMILIMLVAICLGLGLVFCRIIDKIDQINSNKTEIVKEMSGTSEVIKIGNLELVKFDTIEYYDKNTKIVYLWNGMCNGKNSDTVPVPYPASNGLPFRYNEETKQVEEITQ